jgi:hypothetical protein
VSLPKAPLLKRLGYWGNDSTEGGRLISMPLGCWSSLVRLDLGLQANMVMSLEEQQSQSQTCLENLQCMWVKGEDAFVSIFELSKLRLGQLGLGKPWPAWKNCTSWIAVILCVGLRTSSDTCITFDLCMFGGLRSSSGCHRENFFHCPCWKSWT